MGIKYLGLFKIPGKKAEKTKKLMKDQYLRLTTKQSKKKRQNAWYPLDKMTFLSNNLIDQNALQLKLMRFIQA